MLAEGRPTRNVVDKDQSSTSLSDAELAVSASSMHVFPLVVLGTVFGGWSLRLCPVIARGGLRQILVITPGFCLQRQINMLASLAAMDAGEFGASSLELCLNW